MLSGFILKYEKIKYLKETIEKINVVVLRNVNLLLEEYMLKNIY